MSSTSQTVTRSPRIHGCPERWPGMTVIRERSALFVMATDNIIPHSYRRAASSACQASMPITGLGASPRCRGRRKTAPTFWPVAPRYYTLSLCLQGPSRCNAALSQSTPYNENAIREDVHPYEEAMAYKTLLETS